MNPAAMKVRWVTGLWLAAFLIKAASTSWTRDDVADSHHEPDGYSQTANLFLRHRWLLYDGLRRQVSLEPALRGSPIEEYYLRSYLAGDVADFNRGDRSIFWIENEQLVAVDPNRHRLSLPFSERRFWPGRLSYRETPSRMVELEGEGGVLRFAGPSSSLRLLQNPPEVVIPPHGSGSGCSPFPQREQPLEKVKLTGCGGVFLGTANRFGDGLLFNHRSGSLAVEVSVSGQTVPRGNHVRIGNGELLRLQWRGPGARSRHALLWATVHDSAPLISALRPINGQFRRLPTDPHPPFATDILAAIDGELQRDETDAPPIDTERFDLTLTLDSTMSRSVQGVLEKETDELRRDAYAGLWPFRAAITVMDAKTGELLALASYPTSRALGSWSDGERSRRMWLRNHNFSRLPVGSVAKVPFAAAILDSAPFLLGLRIRGYGGGKLPSVLGLALDPPLEDHHMPLDWVGFDDFIQRSSNKYAATLLTLATAVGSDQASLRPPEGKAGVPDALPLSDQFMIDGVLHRDRPALYLPVVAYRGQDQNLRGLAEVDRIITAEAPSASAGDPNWLHSLRRLFGVRFLTKDGQDIVAPAEGDDFFDTSMWRPVLEQLHPDSLPRTNAFRGVSPEREKLSLNLTDHYRTKFLSLILGGGESSWTMPRLAAVFSAIVTGRRTQPRLVKGVDLIDQSDPRPEPEIEPAEPLGLDAPIRQRLVDALRLVSSPSGTAQVMFAGLTDFDRQLSRKGQALGFFSKTGSPDHVRTRPTNLARALDALIAVGALTLNREGRIEYRATGPVDADAPQQIALSALLQNGADMALIARFHARAPAVIAACDTWNDSRPEDRLQFETTASNSGPPRLVRATRKTEDEAVGAAFVFTIGIWPDAAATRGPDLPRIDVVNHQPIRALSVAIVVEGQGMGPKVAVPIAQELLGRGGLRNALEKGW